jgi:Ca2+-binding RTX toxin-like protein
VKVDLSQGVGLKGDAFGDTFINIQNLTGSTNNDVFTGDGVANLLMGGDGNDKLYGLDGNDRLRGEAGNDVLAGGDGNDRIDGGDAADLILGGDGADFLTGGIDADTFKFTAGSQSTGPTYDTLTDFDFNADHLDLDAKVGGISTAVTAGSLSAATFNANLAAALSAAKLAAGQAVLFTASAGDFSGDTFLVVDRNHTAGYQADFDYVFLLSGTSADNNANLDASDFL